MRQRTFTSELPLDVVTIIGSKTVIHGGRLCVQQDLRIDGTLDATVEAEGRVVVGPNGTVRGNVKACDMIIGGRVTGTVVVEGSLTLLGTAVVHGTIAAAKMRVEDGASGRFQASIGPLATADIEALLAEPAVIDEASPLFGGDGAVERDAEALSVSLSIPDEPVETPEEEESKEAVRTSNVMYSPQGTDRFW